MNRREFLTGGLLAAVLSACKASTAEDEEPEHKLMKRKHYDADAQMFAAFYRIDLTSAENKQRWERLWQTGLENAEGGMQWDDDNFWKEAEGVEALLKPPEEEHE